MRVILESTGQIPNAGGRADLNFLTGEIRMIATGLPDIETVNLAGTNASAVYQVWWENNKANKLGVLTKGLDKSHFLNVIVARQVMREIKRLVITVEAESGTVTPSEHVILTAEINSN